MEPTSPKETHFLDFITLREVAQLLGASYQTAYSLAAAGRLGEPIRSGRHYFYPRAVALRAVEDRREERKHNPYAPIGGGGLTT